MNILKLSGLGFALCAILVSGCGNLIPRPPTYDSNSVKQVGTVTPEAYRLPPISSLSAADGVLEKYESAYLYYATYRHDQIFDLGDAAVFGGAIGGLGLAAKNKPAFGLGALLGAVAATGKVRYDPAAQMPIFLRGAKAMACLRRLVGPLVTTPPPLTAAGKRLVMVAPRLNIAGDNLSVSSLNEAVDMINNNVIEEILNTGNGIPTMTQLQTAYDQLYKQREAAQKEINALADADKAGVLVTATFREEALVCAALATAR